MFDYIYGTLHSPSYIKKYQEFLKIDFPRVPYPKDTNEYHRISTIGEKLRKLHIMEGSTSWQVDAGYPKGGSDVVEYILYKNSTVHINDTQYFDNVPEKAWNAYIGGYQPAQKWLKDRKGQNLAFEDIRHYREIIYALVNTLNVIDEFDNDI